RSRILQAEGRGKTVIFTRTKRAAENLVEELNDRGFNAGAVHGDMSQEARERSMAAFKAGKKDVLIATDVAARGIDVLDVTHVINHTVPEDDKAYLHRVGRTGRAGKTGIAVTFVGWEDLHRWAPITRAPEMGIPEPVETYSSSPHLYTDLDIPAGAKGRIKSTPAAPHAEKPPADKESGDRPPRRRRRRGGGDGGGEPAQRPEGGGTHDGATPARRRRTRRRRSGSGGGPAAPPA